MRHLLFYCLVVYGQRGERESSRRYKLTNSAAMYRWLGSSRLPPCGDCMYQDRGNDGLVSPAIRFRGTLGSPKEATGNGRTVDRVICESLPEGYIRTWLLIETTLFLNGNTTSGAVRRVSRWNGKGDRGKESSLWSEINGKIYDRRWDPSPVNVKLSDVGVIALARF